MDEKLNAIAREAFVKINSICKNVNVAATNQNTVSFSTTFETYIRKRQKTKQKETNTKEKGYMRSDQTLMWFVKNVFETANQRNSIL